MCVPVMPSWVTEMSTCGERLWDRHQAGRPESVTICTMFVAAVGDTEYVSVGDPDWSYSSDSTPLVTPRTPQS